MLRNSWLHQVTTVTAPGSYTSLLAAQTTKSETSKSTELHASLTKHFKWNSALCAILPYKVDKTDALQAQDWKAQKIKDRWYVQGASFYACLTSSYSQASWEEILLQPKQKRYTIVSMDQNTKRLSSMHADRPCNSCLFDIWQTADQEFRIWKTLTSSDSSLLPGISKDMKGAFTKWVTKCGEPAPQNAETMRFPGWQRGLAWLCSRTQSIQPALGYVSILGLLVEFQDLKIAL